MKKKKEVVEAPKTQAKEVTKKVAVSTKGKNIMSFVYLGIIIVSIVTMVTLLFVTFGQMKENSRKKAELVQLQKQFEEIATRHENLNDEDYAEVYFNGNTMYIPADKIVIEYKP